MQSSVIGKQATGNFAAILNHRAAQTPQQLAFTFIGSEQDSAHSVTYGELDLLARRVAARIVAAGMRREPVLLLFPPGIDYVAAILGCMYAGCIAVPAYPPRNARQLPRISRIIADASA